MFVTLDTRVALSISKLFEGGFPHRKTPELLRELHIDLTLGANRS